MIFQPLTISYKALITTTINPKLEKKSNRLQSSKYGPRNQMNGILSSQIPSAIGEIENESIVLDGQGMKTVIHY